MNILSLFMHSCMPTEQFYLEQNLNCIDDLTCSVETERQNRVDKFNLDLLNTFQLGPLENGLILETHIQPSKMSVV